MWRWLESQVCLSHFFFPEGRASRLLNITFQPFVLLIVAVEGLCIKKLGDFHFLQVLSQLLRKAKQKNLVIPNVKHAGSEQGTYEGATVS